MLNTINSVFLWFSDGVPKASLFHCLKQDYAYKGHVNITFSVKIPRRRLLRCFCFFVWYWFQSHKTTLTSDILPFVSSFDGTVNLSGKP